MGQHRRAVNGTDRVRAKAGGVVLAALLSGATATGAFNGAPTANATCFSAFGIGNGNGCTSNITSIAIGIGEGATANASFGLLGGAVAIGTNASATNSISAFTGAMAFGDNATASAMFSIFSTLAQFGPGTTAVIGGPNIAIGASAGGPAQTTSVIGGFNIAAQLGPGSTNVLGGLNFALGVSPGGNGEQETVAGLFATFALNLISNSHAIAQGFLTAAVNVLGQTLWPPALLKTVVDYIGSLFPGLAPAPPAPEPAMSLFAMEANESSEQGAQDTALADVNGRVENAAAARNVAPVPTGELQPAEAPAEIEVIDESTDFAVNERGRWAGWHRDRSHGQRRPRSTGTSGTATGSTGTTGTTQATGSTGTTGTATGSTGTRAPRPDPPARRAPPPDPPARRAPRPDRRVPTGTPPEHGHHRHAAPAPRARRAPHRIDGHHRHDGQRDRIDGHHRQRDRIDGHHRHDGQRDRIDGFDRQRDRIDGHDGHRREEGVRIAGPAVDAPQDTVIWTSHQAFRYLPCVALLFGSVRSAFTGTRGTGTTSGANVPSAEIGGDYFPWASSSAGSSAAK